MHDKLENIISEEKGKREEKERRRRERNNGFPLSFFIGFNFGKLFDGKGLFGGNIFKLRIDIYMHPSLLCRKPFFKGNKP